MGIPTLISTATASDAASVDITSGIDSTYDEYMFVFTDIHADSDDVFFQFNGSIDGGSNYNVTKTTSYFRAGLAEADDWYGLGYVTNNDIAQGTGYQHLSEALGGGAGNADEICAGVLHLFTPSNTTYVKHFYSRNSGTSPSPGEGDVFVAGYFNDTNDIDAVSFKMSSGNFDGVIQLFGIA